MLCTAGRPFLRDTYPAVLAEGCTNFVDLETPSTAEQCMKIRIKPPEWASWELCSSLPCPSSNTNYKSLGRGKEDSVTAGSQHPALLHLFSFQACRHAVWPLNTPDHPDCFLCTLWLSQRWFCSQGDELKIPFVWLSWNTCASAVLQSWWGKPGSDVWDSCLPCWVWGCGNLGFLWCQKGCFETWLVPVLQ